MRSTRIDGRTKAFLILYTAMVVGVVLAAYFDSRKHADNKVTEVRHELEVVREEIVFPCTQGRDAKCVAFLDAIVRYASKKQRDALAAGHINTPENLKRFIQRELRREGVNDQTPQKGAQLPGLVRGR